MTKLDPFIFRKENKSRIETVKTELILQVNQMINALGVSGEDFQIEIKPYSKRSKNALAAYWCLISSIVKWDKNNNSLNDKVWDEWFKRSVGLVEEIDLKPIRMMNHSHSNLSDPNCLRYIQKSRSLSNKGDITKPEMQNLLNTVIEFGAQNHIPNCFIPDDELDRLLKFSKGFKNE